MRVCVYKEYYLKLKISGNEIVSMILDGIRFHRKPISKVYNYIVYFLSSYFIAENKNDYAR